jgi:hypothetical protein
MPPNSAQDHTPDEMVDDGIFFIKIIPFCFLYAIMFLSSYMWPCHIVYDEDVIFEEDEEEDEAYFFAGQGTPCNSKNILLQTFFLRVTHQKFVRRRRGGI